MLYAVLSYGLIIFANRHEKYQLKSVRQCCKHRFVSHQKLHSHYEINGIFAEFLLNDHIHLLVEDMICWPGDVQASLVI